MLRREKRMSLNVGLRVRLRKTEGVCGGREHKEVLGECKD